MTSTPTRRKFRFSLRTLMAVIVLLGVGLLIVGFVWFDFKMWLGYFLIAFGGLFFIGHVAWMFYSLPFARNRDDRLECIGNCVPGLAGLAIAGTALVSSPLVALILLLAGAVFMCFGRAVWELIVWPKQIASG